MTDDEIVEAYPYGWDIGVMTDAERNQMLDAADKGDIEAATRIVDAAYKRYSEE
jgi:hypothetical protein